MEIEKERVENLKLAAFGVLQLLKDNLPKVCNLSIQQEDEFVINALRRHGAHLSTHSIDQSHLDPFKLLCWMGCAIINGLDGDSQNQAETILNALITSLEEILMLETEGRVRLLDKDKALIERLVLEEIKGNGDHGIGFNGLFVAFHCLRSTYKQLTEN